MKLDNDLWNDRNSSDFLRHMKFDFFLFVYICTHLINNLFYGFNNDESSPYNHPSMGVRDQNTYIIFSLLVALRFNQLFFVVYQMKYNTQYDK